MDAGHVRVELAIDQLRFDLLDQLVRELVRQRIGLDHGAVGNGDVAHPGVQQGAQHPCGGTTRAHQQHAGALPVWLAPVQVAVLNITDAQADYARDVAQMLKNQGLRVDLDLRNEKITYKIREHSMQKRPYILVVGDKERAAGAVAVRARGNQDLGVMSLEAFRDRIASDITLKS